jgi:hypothetical protein
MLITFRNQAQEQDGNVAQIILQRNNTHRRRMQPSSSSRLFGSSPLSSPPAGPIRALSPGPSGTILSPGSSQSSLPPESSGNPPSQSSAGESDDTVLWDFWPAFTQHDRWTSHDDIQRGVLKTFQRVLSHPLSGVDQTLDVEKEFPYRTSIGSFRGRLDIGMTKTESSTSLADAKDLIMTTEIKPGPTLNPGQVREVDKQLRQRAADSAINGVQQPLLLLGFVGPFFRAYYWDGEEMRPNNSDEFYSSQQMTTVSLEGFVDIRTSSGQRRMQRLLEGMVEGYDDEDELESVFGEAGLGADSATHLVVPPSGSPESSGTASVYGD